MYTPQALEGKDVKDMLVNVGSGGGAAPAAAAAGGGAAAAGGAGGDAPAEEKKEEKEEGEWLATRTSKWRSHRSWVYLTNHHDGYREGRIRRRYGIGSLRLNYPLSSRSRQALVTFVPVFFHQLLNGSKFQRCRTSRHYIL